MQPNQFPTGSWCTSDYAAVLNMIASSLIFFTRVVALCRNEWSSKVSFFSPSRVDEIRRVIPDDVLVKLEHGQWQYIGK